MNDRSPDDLRCACGALVARRTPEGIELKCRRCRRSLLILFQADGEVCLIEAAGAEPGQ